MGLSRWRLKGPRELGLKLGVKGDVKKGGGAFSLLH